MAFFEEIICLVQYCVVEKWLPKFLKSCSYGARGGDLASVSALY